MPFPAATRSALLALAALGSFESGDVAAQTTLAPVTVTGRPDDDVEYRATRSSTFTKTDTPLKEVPASITVVPAQLMKDQAMRSLADVIRYVPGANVHQGEGNRDQFILRGVSTTADLYVDGVRDDAQVFRDLYNLERVEVLKGTARDDLRPRRRRRRDQPGDEAAALRAGARGVADGRQLGPVPRHASTSATRSATAAAWRLNAMAENSGSFRDGVDLRALGGESDRDVPARRSAAR